MMRSIALASMLMAAFTVTAAGPSTNRPDPLKGKQIAESTCIACHGVDGNSTVAANPKIAGQIEAYLVKQLKNFRATDGKPAARINALMAGMAAPLTDTDIANLAAWYSQQKLSPAAASQLNLVAAGQKLWRQGDLKKGIPACAGCHGPAGAGVPAQYPRLAGQFPEYTETQLKAFRQGERANDPEGMMRAIAAKLTDAEIKAVAEYAAGLR